MAVPVYSVGQVLAASDCNNWFIPLVAYKAADTSRAGTVTTVAADPDLTVTLAANATYDIDMDLIYEGGTQGSADLKFTWTVPTGTTMRYVLVNTSTSGTCTPAGATESTTVTAGTNGAANFRGVHIGGTVFASTTAGSLTLNWATNTSNATNTIMHTGSRMTLQRKG